MSTTSWGVLVAITIALTVGIAGCERRPAEEAARGEAARTRPIAEGAETAEARELLKPADEAALAPVDATATVPPAAVRPEAVPLADATVDDPAPLPADAIRPAERSGRPPYGVTIVSAPDVAEDDVTPPAEVAAAEPAEPAPRAEEEPEDPGAWAVFGPIPGPPISGVDITGLTRSAPGGPGARTGSVRGFERSVPGTRSSGGASSGFERPPVGTRGANVR
jgi:hypothetical protein